MFALTSEIKFTHLESPNGISSIDEQLLSIEDKKVLQEKIVPFWGSFKETIIERFSF